MKVDGFLLGCAVAVFITMNACMTATYMKLPEEPPFIMIAIMILSCIGGISLTWWAVENK